MNSKPFYFSVLLLLVYGSVIGQAKQWTIDECVAYAVENNIQVRQSELQAKISHNSSSQANWDYLPGVSAGTGYGLNNGLNIDPVTNQIASISRQTVSANIGASWVVYDGGRKYNSIAQNNYAYMTSLYDLESMKNDIRLNVASAFLQVLLNKEILAVAREQERVTQLQVNRMQKLVDAGSNPKGDLLQLEAQLIRDRQSTVAADNNVNISKIQLANLLQLQDPTDLDISDPNLGAPEASLIARGPEGILATALQNQPSVKSAESGILSSKEGLEVSKSAYLPTLSVNGQISTSYSDQFLEVNQTTGEFTTVPFDQQFNDNINKFVGVNLSIPIFNNSQRYQVRNAKLNLELAELNLEQTKNTLRQTIYQAHADAKASYNSYLAAEKSKEASEEAFKYSQERYNVGALNQFDYENSKNSLAAAVSEMARAKYDYIFKVKVLEFYLTNQVKL
jgi:outer membrane protein